ncbi:baseplate J/gp47 family protein [Neobacillus mesonae]|nr:baseplate J/gp47 family protein [Neobacillus mesonae]
MAYEDRTAAALLQEMLDDSPSDIDKRQGSVTFDLISPASIKMMEMYVELNNVLTFGFAGPDQPSEYLDLRAREFGLTRKPAIKATVTLTFTGPAATVIPAGTVVSTGGDAPIYFETDADVTVSASGTVSTQATAQEPGAAGNVSIGAINTMVGDLVGIVTVTNADNATGGVDTESNADLLARYLDRAQRPATSGNVNQYRQWALEVSGVSDAKVYPVWNGGGTVKVVLLGDQKTSPEPSVITAVQDYIDPTQDGSGQGEAPVGAICTVVGATEVPINVSVDVDITDDATIEDVQAQIETGVAAYLRTLAFVDPMVRYTRIANVILDIPSVIDYTDMTVNGGTGNIVIANGEVAVLGAVTVT